MDNLSYRTDEYWVNTLWPPFPYYSLLLRFHPISFSTSDLSEGTFLIRKK
jgi:hypothetical protein